MSAIRSRDTLPEIVVRKWLFAAGYRFRVCDRKIVGHPDIVLPKLRTLIEVRGCFWHRHGWIWDGRRLVPGGDEGVPAPSGSPSSAFRCALATTPKTNRAFWNQKFRNNVRRDQEHEKLWYEQGWNVVIVWECDLKTEAARERTFRRLAKFLKSLT